MNPIVRPWIVARGAALLLAVLAVVPAGYADRRKAHDQEPTAVLSFVVLKDDNGKSVRNAAVVLHLVSDKDKQERGGLELKTDAEGKCSTDGIPYGKLRVQVLAAGFQTYGEDYVVNQPSVAITIKLKRPGAMYSIYESHPTDAKPKPEEAPKNPPQPQ